MRNGIISSYLGWSHIRAGGGRSGVSGETRACYHPLQASVADPGQISQEAQWKFVKMVGVDMG